MKKWIFVTGTTRGSFTAVEPDGEIREVIGLDVNLGMESGENVKEAAQKLLNKLARSHTIPEVLYKKNKIIAYEILDNGDFVDIKKDLSEVDVEEVHKTEVTSVYQNVKCKWCEEALPKNGAAQFSHLKKHLKQLVVAGLMTQEVMNAVNSLTLKGDVVEILQRAKAAGLLKAAVAASPGSEQGQGQQKQEQNQQKPLPTSDPTPKT
jgi:hypothetical protein